MSHLKWTYFIGLIWFNNECVQVSVNIILGSDLFLDQMVLSLVVEDDMDFLVGGTANVRACCKIIKLFHLLLLTQAII